MTHVPYLIAGYGLTALVLGGYVVRVLLRERALSRAVAATPAKSARRPDETATVPGREAAGGSDRSWS